VVCDDDPVFAAELCDAIKVHCCSLNIRLILDRAHSGDDLFALMSVHSYDIVFLDVRMPGDDGFAIAGRIRLLSGDVAIAFVTCMAEMMPRGFECMAFDYIVKPIEAKRLERALDRQFKRIGANKDEARLAVKLKGGSTVSLPLGKILYIESALHYKRVATVDKSRECLFLGKMSDLEQQLAGRFVRMHRAYLVNMSHIWMVGSKYARLDNNEEIPIGIKHSRRLNLDLEVFLGKKAIGAHL
jgi:DNA-binding LytR/AlgR family response regulator